MILSNGSLVIGAQLWDFKNLTWGWEVWDQLPKNWEKSLKCDTVHYFEDLGHTRSNQDGQIKAKQSRIIKKLIASFCSKLCVQFKSEYLVALFVTSCVTINYKSRLVDVH